MQKPDRVLLVVVGAKAVGAHQLGEAVPLVCGRRIAATAHLGKAYPESAPTELPGRLGPSEPATIMWMSQVTPKPLGLQPERIKS